MKFFFVLFLLTIIGQGWSIASTEFAGTFPRVAYTKREDALDEMLHNLNSLIDLAAASSCSDSLFNP